MNIWRVAIFTATDVQEEIRQKVVAADDRNPNRHLVSSMGDIHITCRAAGMADRRIEEIMERSKALEQLNRQTNTQNVPLE